MARRRRWHGHGLWRRTGFGNGNGYGPGTGGNTGGGLYHIGGGVSAPVPIFTPEAEFSDEARRAKYQGVCLISLIVDAQGNPQNPRVVRPLGMGLDEKALEAVRKYKFKPAMKDGNACAGHDEHRGQLPAVLRQGTVSRRSGISKESEAHMSASLFSF